MEESIKSLIQGAEVVSFDIFDTLIIRCVEKPIDVFKIVAQKLGIADTTAYQNARIKAEREERISKKSTGRLEVTLNDVISRLKADNAWINATTAEMISAEQNAEYETCIPNRPLKRLYDYAASLGKRVVLTSDMYLDEPTISAILQKCNYRLHDRLYLSSQILKTKHDGSLFDHILEIEGTAPEKMAHIGDNKVSDYQNPLTRSIKAFHILRDTNRFASSPNGRRYRQVYKEWPERLDEGLHVNQSCFGQKDFWQELGYTYMGPLLQAFSTWLTEEIQKQGADRVLFLARDGHILNRAFDLLSESSAHGFTHEYMYASRRSWLFPAIRALDEKSLAFLCSGKGLRVQDHLDRIGIDASDYGEAIRAVGFASALVRLSDEADFEKLRALYKHLAPEIIERASRERSTLHKYLAASGALRAERLAIVDIGWHGTLQEALQGHLADVKWPGHLTGYYFGTFKPALSRIEKGLDMKSYACHCGLPVSNVSTILRSVEFFEWFFSAPHGSVINFVEDSDGRISPQMEDNRFEEYRTQTASVAQEAALDYMRDRLHVGVQFNPSAEHPLRMLEDLLVNPTALEAKLIGDIPHVEGFGESREVRHLAKPSSSIFNPAFIPRARSEYGRSHWKSGFKRRLLGPLHRLV